MRLTAILLVVALLPAGPSIAVGQNLNRSQQQQLEERVIPAYRGGDPGALREAALRLVARMSAEQLASVDEYLAAKELPSLGAMFLDARTQMVRRGGAFLIPEPSALEAYLMIEAYRTQVAEMREDANQAPEQYDADARPKDIRGYEAQARILQQTHSRLVAGRELGRQLARLPAGRNAELAQELDAVKQDMEALEAIRKRVFESQILLHLMRLEDAVALLRDSPDIKQRLLAAHFVDVDGTLLKQAFPAKPPAQEQAAFTNPRLNDPELGTAIRAQVDEGAALAGDLMHKSRSLFAGVYWWLRGRYGRGNEFYGLVKSEAWRQSPELLQQSYMPYEIPKGDKPESTGGYAYPDRRHHYTWQWETRTLAVRQSTDSTPLRSNDRSRRTTPSKIKYRSNTTTKFAPAKLMSVSGRRGLMYGSGGSGGGGRYAWSLPPSSYRIGWGDKMEHIYKRLGIDPPKKYNKPKSSSYRKPTRVERTYTETYIPDQDPYAIYQLVGFLEYTTALNYLDQLIESCNAEELKAIDELIAERDELVIETNLSRSVENAASALTEQPRGAGDDFRRRGLNWVTALARAELAAMVVGFAARDDAFMRLAGQRDREEYAELIEDAMRTHYWSLVADPVLRVVLKGESDANRTLAYMRRLIVAEAFLKAAAAGLQGQLTQAELAEVNLWATQFNELQARIATHIANFHQVQVDVQAK